MKGYKSFDKNLKCRDKQYEIGKTYEEKEAKLCKSGIHFCENPLDILDYYDLCNSRFAEIEADKVSDEKSDESKRVAKKLTVKAELSLKGLIDAAFNFLFEKSENTEDVQYASGDVSKLAASGDYSKLAASGNSSHLAASGNYSQLAASGYRSKCEVKGKNSIACNIGVDGLAKASLGGWIVLAEFDEENVIKNIKSAKIDGKKLKADTWYRLFNGKFVEL